MFSDITSQDSTFIWEDTNVAIENRENVGVLPIPANKCMKFKLIIDF